MNSLETRHVNDGARRLGPATMPGISSEPGIRRGTKRFRSLGLAGRSAFWTIALGAAMAASIGLYMHFGAVGILTRNARENLAVAVETSAGRFSGSIERLVHDVSFLSQTPPMHGIVDGNGYWQNRIGVSQAFWRDRLAEVFSALMKARPQYVQARLIGVEGSEIVKVERTPGGEIERIPQAGLQRKTDRPYFQQAIRLARGEIHVSDIELNREYGQIQQPLLPVLRVATPVFDSSGERFGIVILNADARWLVDQIESKADVKRNWFVTSSEGDYLFGADESRTFGFEFGLHFRIQDDFPELAGMFGQEVGNYSGFIRSGSHSYLAAARRVSLDAEKADRHLVVAAFESVDTLLDEINRQRRNTGLIALALILSGSAIAVAMARAVARPLQFMASAATRLAEGREDIDLGDLLHRSDEAGELANAFAAMARGIAERENRLIAQTRELARSNEELAQFAYVASHDLQEPLRMVGSYLELLEHRFGTELDGEAREFIGYAIDGAARMKQLINDLLGYSRAGSQELVRGPVDVAEIVGNVLHILDDQVKANEARIDTAKLPTVEADGVQLERVFMNLIENALKYRSGEPPHIRIGAERIADGWRFEIADNGIGIEPRFQDKVFEIFRRLHGRGQYAGTGIGLSVVKLVIERHGGTIRVEPAPGGGSVFVFTLPD